MKTVLIIGIDEGNGATPTARTFDHFPVTIGRSAECDLLLLDPKVSAVHARLDLRDGKLFLNDEFSTNGTYLAGIDEPIARAKWHPLLPGPASFRIERYALTVCFTTAATRDDSTELDLALEAAPLRDEFASQNDASGATTLPRIEVIEADEDELDSLEQAPHAPRVPLGVVTQQNNGVPVRRSRVVPVEATMLDDHKDRDDLRSTEAYDSTRFDPALLCRMSALRDVEHAYSQACEATACAWAGFESAVRDYLQNAGDAEGSALDAISVRFPDVNAKGAMERAATALRESRPAPGMVDACSNLYGTDSGNEIERARFGNASARASTPATPPSSEPSCSAHQEWAH